MSSCFICGFICIICAYVCIYVILFAFYVLMIIYDLSEHEGVSKWAGTRYFYLPEIVYSTGRNY